MAREIQWTGQGQYSNETWLWRLGWGKDGLGNERPCFEFKRDPEQPGWGEAAGFRAIAVKFAELLDKIERLEGDSLTDRLKVQLANATFAWLYPADAEADTLDVVKACAAKLKTVLAEGDAK